MPVDDFFRFQPSAYSDLEAKIVSTANIAFEVTTLLDDEWDPVLSQDKLNHQMYVWTKLAISSCRKDHHVPNYPISLSCTHTSL